MKKRDAQPVRQMWIIFTWPIESEHKDTNFLKTEFAKKISG